MAEARAVLYGVLPGVAAGLLLVGVFGRRWLGLAMALGLGVAYCLLKQLVPPWPHQLLAGNNDGTQWLVWSVLVAGLLGACGGRRPMAASVVVPAGVVLFAAQAWLMLTNLRRRWEVPQAIGNHALAMVAFVGVWLGMRRIAQRVQGIGLGIVWTGCLTVDSICLLLGRSALQGQLAGGVAAALGASVGTSLWRRPFAVGGAASAALASAHVGLLLAGMHFSSLPAGAALAALLAPLGMLAAGTGGVADGSRVLGHGRYVLGVAITAGLAALAVALVVTGGGRNDYGY